MENVDYLVMSASEFNMTVRQLSKIYDIVRAVDVSRERVITFLADGSVQVNNDQHCFDAWNKNGRCKNCISSMAFCQKNRLSKFEFIDHDVFHVTAQYVLVNDKPCVLEIVERDKDTSLAGAFGKNEFVNKVKNYTERLYTDSLTKVSNRRYFDEQLSSLDMDAVAMIDVDHFKQVNDNYGHLCGDQALQKIAGVIRGSVRNEDSVVRYGGDEFVVAFPVLSEKCFRDRMEMIRESVEKVILSDYEDVKLSISIGGVVARGTVQELIGIADQELYRAKRVRNSVSIRS